MKKFIFVTLSILLLFTFISCNSETIPQADTTAASSMPNSDTADVTENISSNKGDDTTDTEQPKVEPKAMITLNNNKITDYAILVTGDQPTIATTKAKQLKQKIIDITGISIPIVTSAKDKNIVVKCGVGIDARKGEASFDGSDLIIHGGSNDAFVKIADKFINSLKADAVYKSSYKISDRTTTMKAYFKGTSTKDALSYKLGEEIKFEISLMSDGKVIGCPKFSYTIKGDDGQVESGTADGTSGTLTLTTKLTKSGFVRVTVKATELDGKTVISGYDTYDGGAGADVINITQSLNEPSNFDAFWSEQIARIDAIGVDSFTMTPMPSTNDNYLVYDVSIECVGGLPATGVLTIPKNAAAGSLKAKMVFPGYSDGKVQAMTAIYESGTMVLNINPHGAANYGKDAKYYSDMQAAITKTDATGTYKFGFYTPDNMDPETCYFLNMHLRNIQAARWLITQSQYNGGGLILKAGSMGAMQAVGVAAFMGDNVKTLDISYPWLCDLGGATDGKMTGWAPAIRDGNGNTVEGLLYFDTVNLAKRVSKNCTVILYARLGDYTCPPSGMINIYKAFETTNKSMTFRQNGTHGYVSPDNISYTLSW